MNGGIDWITDVRAYLIKEWDLILCMLEMRSLTQDRARMGVAELSEDFFLRLERPENMDHSNLSFKWQIPGLVSLRPFETECFVWI